RLKRDALLPTLARKGIRVAGSEATMFLWLEVPGGEQSDAFAARLLEHGLIVSPGTFFGAAGEGYWRLALVPTEAECRRAAEILGVRVVPPAVARYGAYLSPGVVMMPSYVNIGAWVGPRTMVDTWATVGSGAQIGADVHLAGGVGIGGVLEPLGARPVIVEDGAFIGSRAILTEGIRIGAGAV